MEPKLDTAILIQHLQNKYGELSQKYLAEICSYATLIDMLQREVSALQQEIEQLRNKDEPANSD